LFVVVLSLISAFSLPPISVSVFFVYLSFCPFVVVAVVVVVVAIAVVVVVDRRLMILHVVHERLEHECFDALSLSSWLLNALGFAYYCQHELLMKCWYLLQSSQESRCWPSFSYCCRCRQWVC
jgi:heme exporter protein D